MRALIIFAGAACLALSACAHSLSGTPSIAAQQKVYIAENDFSAALQVAVAYEALPRCSSTQPFPCSDTAVVAKVTAGARAARASLSTAEAAVRANTNAEAITIAATQAQTDVAAFAALAGSLSK